MKVNIIYEAGWVLENFAKQLKKHLDYIVLQQNPSKYSINYFMPYYLLKTGPWKSIGWFTHQEEKPDLKAKFEWAARKSNFCISHSKKYVDLLRGWGIKNVEQITPGISLDVYKPKVVLGYVGRLYTSTDRKNPNMLKFIQSLPFVTLKVTNGKIAEKDMPDFYNSLDAVFVPSTIEGGPMCITEGLACGKPIIAPRGVGVVDEYNVGIIKYEKNNIDDVLRVVKQIYDKKLELRKVVEDHTWVKFAKRHDKVFKLL